MSLNFDLSRIANKDDEGVVYETRKDGQQYVTARTEAMIFATMAVGINKLTEKNAVEFFTRVSFWEKVHGAFMREKGTVDRPVALTFGDVRTYVGLSTNASTLTKAQYLNNVYNGHVRDTNWAIRQAERKPEVAR